MNKVLTIIFVLLNLTSITNAANWETIEYTATHKYEVELLPYTYDRPNQGNNAVAVVKSKITKHSSKEYLESILYISCGNLAVSEQHAELYGIEGNFLQDFPKRREYVSILSEPDYMYAPYVKFSCQEAYKAAQKQGYL